MNEFSDERIDEVRLSKWQEVTLDDLSGIDLNSFFHRFESADSHTTCSAFFADASALPQDAPHRRVLDFLGGIFSMMLRADTPNEPFRALLICSEGRSAEPFDFRDVDPSVLQRFSESVVSPAARARFNDLTWFLNRKDRDAALRAVEAYHDVVIPSAF